MVSASVTCRSEPSVSTCWLVKVMSGNLFAIEEGGRAQVRVALVLVGRDARRLDQIACRTTPRRISHNESVYSHFQMRLDDLDLRDLFEFHPQGGVLRFAGERAVILDAASLGLLRRTLIETLGTNGARSILTQFGYAHGHRTAMMTKMAIANRTASLRLPHPAAPAFVTGESLPSSRASSGSRAKKESTIFLGTGGSPRSFLRPSRSAKIKSSTSSPS